MTPKKAQLTRGRRKARSLQVPGSMIERAAPLPEISADLHLGTPRAT